MDAQRAGVWRSRAGTHDCVVEVDHALHGGDFGRRVERDDVLGDVDNVCGDWEAGHGRWLIVAVVESTIEGGEEVAEALDVLGPVFVHADLRGEVVGVDEVGEEGLLEIHRASELLIQRTGCGLEGDEVEFESLGAQDALDEVAEASFAAASEKHIQRVFLLH